jgi:L1 cell adhesion molecule like protein
MSVSEEAATKKEGASSGGEAPKQRSACGPCIGIDLGTTYSCVSIYRNGRAEVIANDMGGYTTPSVVSFDDETGERLVGEAALSQLSSYPQSTLRTVKRLIGRTIDDPAIQSDLRHWPFTVVGEDVGSGEHAQRKCRILITVGGAQRSFAPEEVSAMVLEKLRRVASDYLGEEVTRAVITVPAHFNDAQRQATMLAGQIAGLHVERIINEPTAAALAYGLDKMESAEARDEAKKFSNILVFDFGGGTLDVTIMRCMRGVFKVIGTGGDTHLGGEDLDMQLVDYCLKTWIAAGRLDPETVIVTDRMRMRLRAECERAKRVLSHAVKTNVVVESFHNDRPLRVEVTRARFEEMARVLFQTCMLEVDKAIKIATDANKSFTDQSIDHVVLVGGSSRIPRIRTMLEERFGQRDGKSILCHSVNPDEVVAQGAAVQAAAITTVDERLNNIILVDVAPLSLGVEVAGERMDVIIKRNQVIPWKAKKTYSTNHDNQPSVSIKVFEGERTETKYCRKLGYFELGGLRPLPKGQSKVEVTFDIDVNGILTVFAHDVTTGRNHKMSINRNAGQLSQEQVQKMINDAEQNRDHDAMIERRAVALNKLETYISSVREHWGSVDVDDAVRGDGVALLASADSWLHEQKSINTAASVMALEERLKELMSWFTPHMQRATVRRADASKKAQ